MKAEDVPEEWVGIAKAAFARAPGAQLSPSLRAAIAAVAPLIARAERKRCAKLAEERIPCDAYDYGTSIGIVAASRLRNATEIAAAIRALGDGEVGG